MGDDYCGGDTNYSNDDNYTCYDTATSNQDVIYSSDVVIDDGPVICSDNNFYIGGCQTIYDGGFQPAPLYNVGFETISIGGGIQPCYDTDFHTIAVGTIEPCYVEQQVFPDYTVPRPAYILIFTVLSGLLVIFVIMGKF